MRWLFVLVCMLSVWTSRVTAWLLRNDDLVFGRWAFSDVRLPFLLRFSLEGAVSAGLVIVPLLLLLLAKLRPAFASAFVVVACGVGVGGAALTVGGIVQARRTAAFPPDSLHARCDCPETVEPRGALECHCGSDGTVVVRVLRGSQLPQIAGRLGDPLVIRETFSREGLTFSTQNGAETIACTFDQPCRHRPECGRCRVIESQAFSPLPDVHCIDQRPGDGRLSGFIQLHRTVWEADSDSTAALAHLDDTTALHTERSELIGDEMALRGTGDDALIEIVFGQRPLGRRGVRTCVVPTGRSFNLTGGFEPPMRSRWARVRLEAVE